MLVANFVEVTGSLLLSREGLFSRSDLYALGCPSVG